MVKLSACCSIGVLLAAQFALPVLSVPSPSSVPAESPSDSQPGPSVDVLSPYNLDAEGSTLARRLSIPMRERSPCQTTLPLRVYPSGGTPSAPSSTNTLVSILFDSDLVWENVATHSDIITQLFSWMLSILINALDLDATQVQTYAVQAYLPDEEGTELLTTYMVHISTSRVADLADQLKRRESAFYTALGSPYKDLAAHVNPTFNITSLSATSTPCASISTRDISSDN